MSLYDIGFLPLYLSCTRAAVALLYNSHQSREDSPGTEAYAPEGDADVAYWPLADSSAEPPACGLTGTTEVGSGPLDLC